MRAFAVSFEHAQKPQLPGSLAFPDYAQDMSEGFPTQDTRVLFHVFLGDMAPRLAVQDVLGWVEVDDLDGSPSI